MLFALGILGGLCIFLRLRPRVFFYIGGTAALVCLGFIGNLVFVNSAIVESLAEQHIAAQNIKSFSGTYLSGNSTGLQTTEGLTTDTLWNRIEVGISYVRYGWYGALAGALLILFASYQKQAPRSMRRDLVGLIIIMLLAAAGLSARSLKAEFDRIQGSKSLANGDLQRALDFHESAIRWDPNLIYNPAYLAEFGGVYYRLGWHNRSETHLYLGDHYMDGKDFLRARREYEVAFNLRPDLLVASRKRVHAIMALGLDYYASKTLGAALSNWQDALHLDPNQVQADLFLAKAYLDYDGLNQARAIAYGQKALKNTRERLVKSDLYNLLGDCYFKQRDFVLAREMYQASKDSFDLVKILINFNAMRGLQGL